MQNEQSDFWSCLEDLVRTCQIVVDRPKGSAHPRYPEFIYPVDYGYLDGTSSADGSGIDVWVGTLTPKDIVGVLCIVDMLKRDSEIKILFGCTAEETEAIYQAQNTKGMRAILVPRPSPQDRP
jgi:inorganic pyrophosphatase